MRLIDADALFDNVLEAYGIIFDESEANLFMKMIIRAPTVNPESMQPQWISVTERLPETSQDVLVTRRTRGTVRVMKAFYMPSDNGGIWASQCGICTTGVIAWMPMPEPYTPAGEEGNT